MDIKGKIEELVEKIKNDDDIADKFREDPVATVERLLDIDLPNDQLDALVDGIKAKLSMDRLGGALGGLFGKK